MKTLNNNQDMGRTMRLLDSANLFQCDHLNVK